MYYMLYCDSHRNTMATLLLRLGLLSSQIRHENGAFRKSSSNGRNLKTPALRLWKTFWKRSDNVTIPWYFPARGLLKHKCKMIDDCRIFFKFFRRNVDRKDLIAFSEWHFRFQILPAWCVRNLYFALCIHVYEVNFNLPKLVSEVYFVLVWMFFVVE